MTTLRLLLAALIGSTVAAFAPQYVSTKHSSLSVSGVTEAESSLTSEMKELLENLHTPDSGLKLLSASSESWRSAIYNAVAAPTHVDDVSVAKSLQNAMSKPDNQFAILTTGSFEANFPSDPVIHDDKTAWVECRLREKESDKLLVTMGISLVLEDNRWLISALDWQDFRDEFYPGLSGREWLRSF